MDRTWEAVRLLVLPRYQAHDIARLMGEAGTKYYDDATGSGNDQGGAHAFGDDRGAACTFAAGMGARLLPASWFAAPELWCAFRSGGYVELGFAVSCRGLQHHPAAWEELLAFARSRHCSLYARYGMLYTLRRNVASAFAELVHRLTTMLQKEGEP